LNNPADEINQRLELKTMGKKETAANATPRASRREFVRSIIATTSLPLFSASVLSACQHNKATLMPEPRLENTCDQALELIFSTGQDHRGSTHVPMVAETLIRLKRTDQVIPWVESHYRSTTDGKKPEDFNRIQDISQKNFREALGQESRRADWVEFFERQIAEAGWKHVLGQWATLLIPGMAAHAAHGLIRTAHAVRSLESLESKPRKRELAEGMGLWAATYQLLPEPATAKPQALKPSQAIRQVQPMPTEQVRRGNIVMALTSLDEFPAFANVINLVDTRGDTGRFLADLTETFAGVYLANARDFRRMITLVHAVTGTSAARLLLPYVKAETRDKLLRYGWQLAAGLFAISGDTMGTGSAEANLPDKEDLIERAIKNSSAHAIKFTEACLREYAFNPKPVYLRAAEHATKNLRG
jgi:hypothetical protein